MPLSGTNDVQRQAGRRSGRGKVLVLGSDTRSFLSVVRSLGRRGIEVHAAWHTPGAPALRSRYLQHTHQMPAPSSGDGSWKEAFRALLDAERFDLVIPCNDPSLIPLQEHRGAWEHQHRVYLLSERVYELAFDKSKCNALVETFGIPVPRTRPLTSVADARAAASDWGLPLVLKPARSYDPQNLRRKNHVLIAESSSQLEGSLPPMLERGPVVAQEFFPGTGAGVEFLSDRGRILVAFQHVRLHEPRSGGGSSYRKSTPVAPELLAAAEKLVRELDYTGVGMVEFRLNAKTGRWIFVEINGRFWGSLPLAIACGADFPWYLYQLLVEGQREFPTRYKTGLSCRNATRDVHWFREVLSDVRLDRRRFASAVRQIAGELRYPLLFRERSDTLVLDDMRPAFAEAADGVRSLFLKIRRRARAALLSASPLRRLYCRRVRAAVRQARTVLFVCKGNICRSPFAHHYARMRFPERIRVISSGHYPRDGRECPANAVEAARELGLDLTTHRSTVIDERTIDSADVIFTFDDENRETLCRQFPAARRRIYRLGLLVPNGGVHIRDPYGGSLEDFQTAYEMIRSAIDVLADGIAPRTEHAAPEFAERAATAR